MEPSNRALIVIVYVLSGLVLAGAAAIGWLAWRPQGGIEEALRVEADPGDSANSSPRQRDPAFVVQRQEAFAEAARRVQQLETLLERKTELLNRRTELLNQRTAEYDALRAEADRYLMLLLEQAGPPMPVRPGESANSSGSDADRPTPEKLQAQLESLREELARSALLEEALEGELDQMRGELQAARQRVAEVELRQLLEGPVDAPGDVSTEALVRVGEEAATVLAAALRDERADVRRWAAEVLAQMGPAARPALAALRTARDDTDPAVRQAARRALTAINSEAP